MLSLSKAERLMKEAVKDLEIGSYNKAASAAYFSLRMFSEFILLKGRITIPRRDDKLANLIENIGLREIAETLRYLYDLRKKADYSSQEVNEIEAGEAVSQASKLLEKTKQLLDS